MKNNKKIFSLISLVCLMFVMLFGAFGTANAQPEVLKECIKIRQNFTLKVAVKARTATDDGRADVKFVPGAIVASKAITSPGSTACMRGASPVASTELLPAVTLLTKKDTNYHLFSGKEYGIIGMFNFIYNITNWVFFIMTLIAVLMIVYGGFTYITAAGDPSKAGKGKSILTVDMYLLLTENPRPPPPPPPIGGGRITERGVFKNLIFIEKLNF